MPPITHFVYELRDPRSKVWKPESAERAAASGLHAQAFYVGKASVNYDRLAHHLNEARKDGEQRCRCYKCNVIRRILAAGLRPVLARVEEFTSEAEAMHGELKHALRFPPGRLTNTQQPGLHGWSHSPATRRRMSAARMGKKLSPTTIAKMTQASRSRGKLGLNGRAEVVERLQEGISPGDIALEFGVTRKMIEFIRRNCWKSGELTGPPSIDQRHRQVLELLRAGVTPEVAARQSDYTLQGVWTIISRYRTSGALPRKSLWGGRQPTRRAARTELMLEATHHRCARMRLDDIVIIMGLKDQSGVVRLLRDARLMAASVLDDGSSLAAVADEYNTTPQMVSEIVEGQRELRALPRKSNGRLKRMSAAA